ncbi:MAG: type II CRISPR-associated endonuclease Cas1 [Actinomycetaceae bacterium]|nr:type II CRISPR-associated endonuclease Cas1 [Actinomycetaceae bacterium]
MKRWQVADFSAFSGEIISGKGKIAVRSEQGVQEVPVADLAMVLVGVNTKLTSGVLHRLLGKDISVLFCDWRGVPIGGAYPWVNHSRVGARQIAQADLSVPRKKNAWARVVKAKVLGQARVLEKLDLLGYKQLVNFSRQIKSGDSTNIEARAAKFYWSCLFGGNFRRFPQLQLDDVNSFLDYGYAVLRGHAMNAVLSAGLAPALGIFHHGRSNPFNLVDDLIEPFRPAIDYQVASLPAGATLQDSEMKRALVAAAGSVFSAQRLSVPAEMQALAQRFGRYCENEEKSFIVHHWVGE